jgi:exodeoxyribonuclease III
MKELKILCWNVNGVRAAKGKGFLEWLYRESPDILCLQETKAHPEQLDRDLTEPHGYYAYWNYPEQSKAKATAALQPLPKEDHGECKMASVSQSLTQKVEL